MIYTAILFDMDGVVIDTHHAVTQFWLALAGEYGVQLSQADFQQHIYGCPMNHTFDVLFPSLNDRQRRAILARLQDYEIKTKITRLISYACASRLVVFGSLIGIG